MTYIIPDKYPKDLNECLKILENIKYEAYGCPIVFLDYNYTFKYWSVVFRNPVKLKAPEIKESTPEKAVHKMLDYLKEIERKTRKS